MIRILIYGEGSTDCGRMDYGTGKLIDGPVEIYIRHILGKQWTVEFSLTDLKSDKTRRPKFQRIGKSLRGHDIKAALLMRMAISDKYHCAAYYSDADRVQGRDARKEAACRARYNELKDGIIRGFESARLENQRIDKIPGLAIIPMKMIESWLMGDPVAFPRAFSDGKKKYQERQETCPNRPELDWGAHDDPSSNYPKNRLARILDIYGKTCNQMTFYEIAKHANVETLRQTCPISFADFYEQVKRIV